MVSNMTDNKLASEKKKAQGECAMGNGGQKPARPIFETATQRPNYKTAHMPGAQRSLRQ